MEYGNMLSFKKGVTFDGGCTIENRNTVPGRYRGYTTQSNKLGAEKTTRFNEQFEQKLRELTKTHKGDFIKTIGDAVLIFFADPGNFLDFAGELRLLSKQRKLDMNDFFADLRIVAHFGNFSFNIIDEIMADLIGPEGIKVFRIEKHAKKHEVVVTEFLHDILENTLTEKYISSIELGRETLKGFNKKANLYKLVFPEKEEKVPSGLLMLKMAQLEEETKIIPVFGDLYPAMSMADNFIDLDIKSQSAPKQQTDDLLNAMLWGNRRHRNFNLSMGILYQSKSNDAPSTLSVKKLYESQRRGIILGLPGSGKTTILKYFAYREFDGNRGDTRAKKAPGESFFSSSAAI